MSKTVNDYARCKNQLHQQVTASEFSGNYGGRLKRYIRPNDDPVNRIFCSPLEIFGDSYLTHVAEDQPVHIGVADCLDRDRKLTLKFHGGGTVVFLTEDQDNPKNYLRERKLRAIRRIREKAIDQELPWFQEYAGASASDILTFCKAHGIVKETKNAVNLAEKCFQPFVVRLEEYIDPETDDKQVVIALSVRGKSREEVLAAYHSYTQQSINILPWPKSNLIGLSYDIS